MKIVHVYKDYFPPVHGGIEQTVSRLATSQAAAGHDVTVLCSAHGGRVTREESVSGVRVVRVAEWGRALSAPLCPTMPWHLARERADLYHLHYPNPTGEVSWLLARPRGVLVVTFYADIVRQSLALPLYRPVVHAVLREADLILGLAERHLEATPFLHPYRDRWRVVPLGIELARFATDTPRVEIPAMMRRGEEPVILFVGFLRHYKGLDDMLHAMREIPAKLVIVGEGPERARLESLHARLGLGDRVTFAGHVPDADLPAWMAAADIGVLPSNSAAEAWGLAMVEMMASGLPVVCTELGTGTSVVNQHGESGFVVPPRDPRALAAALNRLVQDPALRERMGRAARHRALTRFSREAMVRAVEEVYAEAIESYRRRAGARKRPDRGAAAR